MELHHPTMMKPEMARQYQPSPSHNDNHDEPKKALSHQPTLGWTESGVSSDDNLLSGEDAGPQHSITITPIVDPPPSRSELLRDDVLRVFGGTVVRRVAICAAVLIVVDGALWFFLVIGAHRMCDTPSRFNCEPRNWWYNFSIQFLNVNISYLAVVSLPWKLAHAHHLTASPRSSAVGRNLYGQPTEEVWFHIPPGKRKTIVFLLVINSFAQYLNQSMRIVYSTYERQSTWPGNLLTSCFFLTSFSCAMVAGLRQLHAESTVRKQQPGRFPPGPIVIAQRYVRGLRGKQNPHPHSEEEEEQGENGVVQEENNNNEMHQRNHSVWADDEPESSQDGEELMEDISFQEREEKERKRAVKGMRRWIKTDRTSLDMWGLYHRIDVVTGDNIRTINAQSGSQK